MPKSAPVGVATRTTSSKKALESSGKVASKSTSKPDVPTGLGVSEILATRVQEQAAIEVAAYQLLGEIEQRTDSLAPGDIAVGLSESEFLRRALPEISLDQHSLSRELGRRREARKLFEDGASIGSISEAEADLLAAREAEAHTAATIEDLDIEAAQGPVLASQIRKLQEKFRIAQQNRTDAESKLRAAKLCYDVLLDLAPDSLKRAVSRSISHLQGSSESRRLARLTSEIETLGRSARAILREGPEDAARSGNWWTYLGSCCPSAIRTNNEGERRIVAKEVADHLSDLEQIKLPEMKQEQRDLADAVKAAEEDCRAPLHEWAATGKLTVEMLLAAM